MKRFLIGWNLSRFFRLLFGIGARTQGILQKEGLMLAAGGWILFGAISNLGCCGSGGCSLPTSKKRTGKTIE